MASCKTGGCWTKPSGEHTGVGCGCQCHEKEIMTAIERIKEIEWKLTIADEVFSKYDELENFQFLLKAFQVIREIAIEFEESAHDEYCTSISHDCKGECRMNIEHQFEEKMK